MKSKRLIALFLCLCLFSLTACVEEYPEPIFDPANIKAEDRVLLGTEEESGVVFSLFNDRTCHISGLIEENLPSLVLHLPDYYSDYKIIAIEDEVFRESKITKITLPNSLKFIGNRAFKNASIESVSLPDSVLTIGEEAFASCQNLIEVNLSKSLTSIPYGAFANCKKIETLIIPEGVKCIGEESFSALTSLKSLSLPQSLVEIGPYAFFSCSMDSLSITIPEKVEKIGKDAFKGTSLIKNNTEEFLLAGNGVLLKYSGNKSALTLPENVLYLSNAFDKTPVKELALNETLSGICQDAFLESSVETISYSGTNEEILNFLSDFT